MSAENGHPLRVDDIAALARHASMSSSYKPALLKAIVRIVKRDALRTMTLEAIGAQYLELYGVQTDPSPQSGKCPRKRADIIAHKA